jgi:hypothetical protein
MQTPTVGIKEGDDVEHHDLCLEGIGIFEVNVPHLVNNVTEELGNAMLGSLITGVVINAGFMGSLRTNADDHCNIIGNCLVVDRKLGQV